MRIRLAHGALVAALMLASSLVQAQTGRPTWNELTPAQREALAPLSKDWETLDAERKRKWIEVAAKYPNLSPDGKQIVVPQEAIMDSGDKQYLFVVYDGGVFEPRVIQMGAKLEGNVVVLSGLNAGETIVTSGNFLIDSESRLKSAMAGMQH